MPVPTYPSSISLANIQTEFGGANPIGISEYYSGGSYVGSGTANSTGTPIPSSGQISFLNFSGAVSYVGDPTQPTVTATHWHGYPSWGVNTPGLFYAGQITRTGDVVTVTSASNQPFVLDAAGNKMFSYTVANNISSQTGSAYPIYSIFRTSAKNPNRFYMIQYDPTNQHILTKVSNTGSGLLSSNVAYPNGADGQANAFYYIWDIAPTSGSSSACTSVFAIVTSNTTTTNGTHSIVKVRGSDLTTIEWGKTVSVTPTDLVNNVKPYWCWTNIDESAVYVVGGRGVSNTVVLVLNTSDGATQQSWQFTGANYAPIRKPTAANNVAFIGPYSIYLRSNTGSNVTALTITNSTFVGTPPDASGLPMDVDYDSNLYIGGFGNGGGGTVNVASMFAKYNSSLTRQWQVRIRPVNSSNCVGILWCAASNNRVVLYVSEFTNAFDGKKWYVSGYGERRLLYLNSASGNTGTFGQFIVESNTASIFGAVAGPTTSAYTFSPRSTYECSFASRTIPTITSNSATFTRTTL